MGVAELTAALSKLQDAQHELAAQHDGGSKEKKLMMSLMDVI